MPMFSRSAPFISLVLLACISVTAQNRCTVPPLRQTDNWFFGDRVAWLFNDNGVASVTVNNVFSAFKGCSSISDANGNLLLFSDGQRVYNSSFQQLATGVTGLLGYTGVTQSVIFVPRPGNPNRYFIFTLHYIDNSTFTYNPTFSYSEIDISGSGYIVPGMKDIQLLPKVSEKVTAVFDSISGNYWVITHDLNTNVFYSYRITPNGVSPNPVTSAIGSNHNGEPQSNLNSQGYMKASPDGKRIALAIGGQRKIEVFDFNSANGLVSNYTLINVPDPVTQNIAYGIEFSPDGRFLYFTTFNISAYNSNKLYQVDLNAAVYSPVLLNPSPAFVQNVSAIQLGRDGKIYVGHHSSAMLGCIENPKRPGTACNYVENIDNLQGRLCRGGLPNFVTTFLRTPHFYFDPTCFGENTTFRLVNTSNVSSVLWNFGDGSATSTDLSPTHVFSAPGTYQVTVTENGTFTYSQQVVIKPLPFPIPSLPPSDSVFFLYPGSALTIDAGPGYYAYLWLDRNAGSQTIGNQQTITLDREGSFRVIVEDTLCCIGYRNFYIISLDLVLPNAFSPTQSTNNIFRASGGSNVYDYNMRIYNRWGQMVFQEYRPNGIGNGWNGTFEGSVCPQGVYSYILTFDVEYQSAMKQIVKQGTIMLVR